MTGKIVTLTEVKWIRRQDLVKTLNTIFEECSSFSIFDQEEKLPRLAPNPRGWKMSCTIDDNEISCLLVMDGKANSQMCRGSGFDMNLMPRLQALLDTQDLAREVKGEKDFMRLRSIVHELGLRGKTLYLASANSKSRDFHNAGNGAAYTTEALLLLSVKEHEAAIDASNAGCIESSNLLTTEALARLKSSSETQQPRRNH